MVAPETGMDAVHLLEPVDHPCLREEAWREPAGHVGKANRDSENGSADRGQPRKRGFVGQGREPVSLGCGWIVGQTPAPQLTAFDTSYRSQFCATATGQCLAALAQLRQS
jgi:hypothetical protein